MFFKLVEIDVMTGLTEKIGRLIFLLSQFLGTLLVPLTSVLSYIEDFHTELEPLLDEVEMFKSRSEESTWICVITISSSKLTTPLNISGACYSSKTSHVLEGQPRFTLTDFS